MPISRLQIFNAINAYGRQISFAGHVEQKKPAGTPAGTDEKSNPEHADQAVNEDAKDRDP